MKSDIRDETEGTDLSLSVTDMVIKSQRLLLDVDNALAGKLSGERLWQPGVQDGRDSIADEGSVKFHVSA